MRCPDDETLVRWLASERTADGALDLHLDACASCRAVVAALARSSLVEHSLASGPVTAWASDFLPAGVHVGRYRITARIGAGAMGVVYRAHDPELRRDVAIKMLRAALADDGERRARLLREARSLATLSHPNVVPVYDVGVHDGHAFLAMELVPGTTLRAWLAGAPAREAVLAALRQLADGLAAVHAAGLVHRDFKPDNALVTDDGRVRVSDFGLVGLDAAIATSAEDRAIDVRLTQTGALVGTPRYMAPEQLGGGVVGPAADQFAFFVVACEALTGERPFAGDTADDLLAAMRAGLFTPALARLGGELRELVRRGLAADPDRRHPDMAAVAAALARPRRRVGPPLVSALALATLAAVVVVGSRAPAAASIAAPTAPVEPSATPEDSIAAAALAAGRAHVARGEFAPAIRELTAAHAHATASGAWAIASDAAILLVRVEGYHAEDHAAGTRWHRHAAADLDRLGDDPERRIQLVDALATVNVAAGDYPSARAQYQLAFELCHALWGDDDPRTAAALARLASVEAKLGPVDAAIDRIRSALVHLDPIRDRSERAHALVALANAQTDRRDRAGAKATLLEARGLLTADDGPLRGRVANNLASALLAMGEHEAAARELTAAQTLLTAAYGADHPNLANLVVGQGVLLASTGDFAGATVLFERALALKEQAFGPDHPSLLPVVTNLANLARIGHDYPRVRELQLRAIDLAEARHGADSLELAQALEELANTFASADDVLRASALTDRALSIRLRHVPETDPSLALNWLLQSKIHIAREDWPAADATLARALAIASAADARTAILLAWAESLARRGRRRDGLAMAARARAELVGVHSDPALVAEVERWIAYRRRR